MEIAVNRLPTELLIYIFNLDWYNAGVDEEEGSSPLRREICLSHVSQRWRYIALSMPHFWTTISAHDHSSVEEISWYLTHSANSELDVFFSHDQDNDTIQDHSRSRRHFRALLAALVLHIDRWSTLDVNCGEMVEVDIQLYLSLRRVPALKTFRVTTATSAIYSEPIFQNGAPSLRHVRHEGSGFGGLQPPLQNITTLSLVRLYNIRLDRMFPLLLQAVSLVSLTFHEIFLSDDIDEGFAPPIDPTPISTLRFLQVTGIASDPSNNPELHFALVVHTYHFIGQITPTSIVSLHTDIDSAMLPSYELYTRYPEMEEFTYHCQSDDFLDTLGEAFPPESGIEGLPWPNLHTLTLPLVDPKKLIDMLVARDELGHPVSTLVLPPPRTEVGLGLRSKPELIETLKSMGKRVEVLHLEDLDNPPWPPTS